MAADPAQPPQPGAGVLPLLQPARVLLATLVRVAGTRWRTEENVAAGKELAGLDEHQVRTCTSWHRWVTLAMLALAFLTVTAAAEHAQPPPPGMIPLTRNEIARLLADPPARPAAPGPGCSGQPGAGATSTPPAPATTGGKPLTTHDHDDPRPEPIAAGRR